MSSKLKESSSKSEASNLQATFGELSSLLFEILVDYEDTLIFFTTSSSYSIHILPNFMVSSHYI